jgi:hypothetical protein
MFSNTTGRTKISLSLTHCPITDGEVNYEWNYTYGLCICLSSIHRDRTIILPVLYGCETWLLTLRVFENRVLKRVFGPKRDEVTGMEKVT